jgi:hypothetical protein
MRRLDWSNQNLSAFYIAATINKHRLMRRPYVEIVEVLLSQVRGPTPCRSLDFDHAAVLVFQGRYAWVFRQDGYCPE